MCDSLWPGVPLPTGPVRLRPPCDCGITSTTPVEGNPIPEGEPAMDLSLDEHKLIIEFRRLSDSGRKSLLDHAAVLARQELDRSEPDSPAPENRCSVPQSEKRPETAKEPIFTE